ncbi:MAG: phage portal protein [Bacteroidota bacterium]|nr:phage portal protein [Bacteroidota bacterium]
MGEIQLSEVEIIIQEYLISKEYKEKIAGNNYFKGLHDILNRKRTAIGENGQLVEVPNLPNNKLVDNQYRKLVKQKVNYILAKPFSLKSENKEYSDRVNKMFGNKEFMKILKRIGTDVYNTGLGWIYVYYGDDNELKFKGLKSIECIPVWKTDEHDELDYLVRLFDVKEFEKGRFSRKTYAEIYTLDGIQKYELNNRILKHIETESYIKYGDKGYNWEKLPIICFRSDELEQPLLNKVRNLQDSLNELISDFANNMQENNRNAILILKEYDGENLGTFRHNLNVFGAVKVKNDGGLEKLEMKVDSSNFESVIKILKKAIIENGGGFDSKSDTLGNNPNQLNIRSMYSEIDLEANDLETEFQASFEKLLWFVNIHLKNTTGDNVMDDVEFILNRDILVNESQAIADLRSSVGLMSEKTIVANHPLVTNPEEELEQMKKERQESMEQEEYEGLGEHSHDVDE